MPGAAIAGEGGTGDVPSAVATGIGPYYAAVTNSSHMDFLAEYNTDVLDYAGNPGTGQKIGRGTAEAAITIAPSSVATSITNDQIASELQAQIKAGHLPTPDANMRSALAMSRKYLSRTAPGRNVATSPRRPVLTRPRSSWI